MSKGLCGECQVQGIYFPAGLRTSIVFSKKMFAFSCLCGSQI
jgi:hypothetical protein